MNNKRTLNFKTIRILQIAAIIASLIGLGISSYFLFFNITNYPIILQFISLIAYFILIIVEAILFANGKKINETIKNSSSQRSSLILIILGVILALFTIGRLILL